MEQQHKPKAKPHESSLSSPPPASSSSAPISLKDEDLESLHNHSLNAFQALVSNIVSQQQLHLTSTTTSNLRASNKTNISLIDALLIDAPLVPSNTPVSSVPSNTPAVPYNTPVSSSPAPKSASNSILKLIKNKKHSSSTSSINILSNPSLPPTSSCTSQTLDVPPTSTHSIDLAFALASLLEDVTNFQKSLPDNASSRDIQKIQAAMGHVVDLIKMTNDHPPAYNTLNFAHSSTAKIPTELDALLTVIEQLNQRGRLVNQQVHLSSKQESQFEALKSSTALKYDYNRHLDLAHLGDIAAQLARSGRLSNQDANPSRIKHLELISNELIRLSARPVALDLQRFSLTEHKQKSMFLAHLGNRISRLNNCRLDNQSADPPHVRKDKAFSEVERALDRLSAHSSFSNQRYQH